MVRDRRRRRDVPDAPKLHRPDRLRSLPMANLTSNTKVNISPVLSLPNDLANLNWAPNYAKSQPWGNGVAANQVNEVFADQRTLVAATSEDLDLNGAALQ